MQFFTKFHFPKAEEEKKTDRYVEGGVHEDVEDGPDGKVDPEGEIVGAFLFTPATVFQINPGGGG